MLDDVAAMGGGRSTSPVFVGRLDELARLDLALERSVEGSPGMVLMGGDAGVGKSRLLAEWRSRLAPSAVRTASGSCYELSSGAVPYGPTSSSADAARVDGHG